MIAHNYKFTCSKSKQQKDHALIGLVPLNNGYEAKKFVGDRKDYITKSQITFVDGLLRFITLGTYTPSTTNFYVPLSDVSAK
jgi:hypothetical protein